MYYEDATHDHISYRGGWQALATKYKIPLPAVALQFAFLPEVVTAVCIGARTPEEVQQNVELLQYHIPVSLWKDAKYVSNSTLAITYICEQWRE